MDMAKFIVPRSDQLNSDDLLVEPRTVRITRVTGTGNTDQPVAVHFEGDAGKPYKPCRSMRRVLVAAWGADASQYAGRSMTLYRDPKVVYGGMEVGGIRISHLSHIDKPLALALTVTRSKRAPYRVLPLETTVERGSGQSGPMVAPAVHVGAELGLPPLPEDKTPPERLLAPDGVLLPPDQAGLKSWSAAWRDQLGRIDLDPTDVLRDLTTAASGAAALFGDKPKTVAWIEGFVAEMRATWA